MMRARSKLCAFSVLLRPRCSLIVNHPITSSFNLLNPSPLDALPSPTNAGSFALFTSSPFPPSKFEISNDTAPLESEEVSSDDREDEDDTHFEQLDLKDEGLAQDVRTIMGLLCEAGKSPSNFKQTLENCNVKVSSELVVEVLSRVRNDWEAAFTFFLWAGNQPGYVHSVRQYHSMISILAKMRKFDTAWALIDEMKGDGSGLSLVTPQTLLIMIRRYCAVHDVGRAISTFYAYRRFQFDIGIEEFQSLLSALCRYKNVQDAEHLLFCNRNVFPFNTKSFNIILNGWCNLIVSPREAERIWKEMTKWGIKQDVVSYGSMISCYSKSSNFHKVLKLFDRMKEFHIAPDRKVYNAVIHALAKGKFVKEAINLMRIMDGKGIPPNVVTYNSLIKPLCKACKINEAGEILEEMLQRGLSPTTQTYHAFFRIIRTGEDALQFLEKMKNTGCHPTIETYIMLIRKFCRWRQLDVVLKLWNEMTENGMQPDRSSYIVLIHGLFLNGKLEEAHKYYIEMQEKQFLPELKTYEMLQAWLSGKQVSGAQTKPLKNNKLADSHLQDQRKITLKKFDRDRNFLRQPETKNVVRERGFSFWEQ